MLINVVAEVVRVRHCIGERRRIRDQDQAVERIVLVAGGVAVRVGFGGLVAVGVVGVGGSPAERRGHGQQTAQAVVGVRRHATAWWRHGRLPPEVVVLVRRLPPERVGLARQVAVEVVGVGGRFARRGGQIVSDRLGLHGAVGIESEAHRRADHVAGEFRPEIRIIGEGADVAQFVGGLSRLPFRSVVTLVVLATKAVSSWVWFAERLTMAGETVTETGGWKVTVAVADLVLSAWLVAVTAMVCRVAVVTGAVYRPEVVIEPTSGLMDQLTALFAALVATAVNC